MKYFAPLFLLLFSFDFALANTIIPNPFQAKQIFQLLRHEMIRLDGEGLIARIGRPYDFITTTDALLDTPLRPGNAQDFFALFKRLDGAYTNLHSYLVTDPEIPFTVPYNMEPSVWLFLDSGDNQPAKAWIDAADSNPEISVGDEVVAINGKAVSNWLNENFLFCKFPLRIQCDHNFESNLHELRLSWRGDTPLIYTIRHSDRLIDVEVKFNKIQSNTNGEDRKKCDYRAEKRYPDFHLVYKGRYACIFENKFDSSIGLMRISSFNYKKSSSEQIQSVQKEVDSLFPFWQTNAGKFKNFIIDVIDNHGGNAPIPYYQIFFHSSFQEQFVRFKKIPEMENPRLRQALFWDEPAQELSYQRWLSNGSWEKLPWGQFTTPIPMFCANENLPCEDSSFSVRPHSFQAKLHLMVNEWCVSSCDGFVWAMKNRGNAALYGFPQAADSAYSRLRIDLIRDDSLPLGVRTEINKQNDPYPNGFLLGQIVAVTQATDEAGNIFNGRPEPLKRLVPYRFGIYYPKAVLSEVMQSIKN